MSTNPRRVRIVMPQHGRGEVYLDDVKVEAVYSVAFTAGVGNVNHVTLETIGHPEVTLEGVADVTVVGIPGAVTDEDVDRIRAAWFQDAVGRPGWGQRIRRACRQFFNPGSKKNDEIPNS